MRRTRPATQIPDPDPEPVRISRSGSFAANLARDRGFERPSVGNGGIVTEVPGTDLGGWIVAPGGDSVGLVDHNAADGVPVYAGVQSLDLNGIHAGVYQDIPTTPGK